jgi:biopolymer transport protein ExbD
MEFRRRLSPEARVDLVPMIDVVFQLVIFFMVTSTFMMTPGIDLLFPASTTSEPVVMSSFVVTVASPDEIYINRDQYSLSTFGDALAGIDEQERAEIDSVIIEGDRSVSYDLLIKILDRLRLYGFKSISLRTLEDTTSQTP